MRFRTFALAAIVVGSTVMAQPAWADDDDDHHDDETPTDETPTEVSIPPDSVGIGDNMYFTGGVVTTPGQPPRSFDAYQAAVFVQSWLSQAFFGGSDILRDPPADAVVSQVDITGTWFGDPLGTLTVYYAADGATPYIAYPQAQRTTTPTSSPPPPENWFEAPPRVVDAFNGTAELIETVGTVTATSTPGTTAEGGGEDVAAPSGDGDGDGSASAWPWAVGAVAVAAAGGLALRRRRSTGATAETPVA